MRELIHLLPAVLLAGCANLFYRTDASAPNGGPYACTRGVAECVAAPFREPSGPEGGIAKAYCTLLLPVTAVDLPFEAVLDTLLLPWDVWAGIDSSSMREGAGNVRP